MNFKTSLSGVLLLAACHMSTPTYETWLGKWNGPEGTYLDIAQTKSDYIVTVSDLDGPKTFTGKAMGEGIAFTRNGRQEIIHAGNGGDTGMKWLNGKSNCLVIRIGEGFCRD